MMTLEQTIDAIQSGAQTASKAVSTVTSREARGDMTGALAQLAEAENALRMALAGIANARAMLAAQ